MVSAERRQQQQQQHEKKKFVRSTCTSGPPCIKILNRKSSRRLMNAKQLPAQLSNIEYTYGKMKKTRLSQVTVHYFEGVRNR
jgi:hypothetical protein